MAFETTTPNMLLPSPAVGLTSGPQYATDINNCLTIIDQHNHSNGSGVQITPSGLNISADLSIQGNNLTNVRTTRYVSQANTLSAPDVGAVYVVGNELFYNDINANPVQLTKNGSVNGASGNIGGLTAPASANYSTGTFIFESNINTAANIDGASYVLRNNTANSHGLTLTPPNAMGFDYTLTMPSIPTSTSFVTLDTSGNLAGSISTSSGITLAMLAAAVQASLNPAGSIIAYGGSSVPSGYLMCDGSAISRTSFSALFSAIGINYGVGDGSTTFNIPNALGVFLRGSSTQTIGGVVYSTTLGTTEADAMQGHTHGENKNDGVGGTSPSTSTTGGGSVVSGSFITTGNASLTSEQILTTTPFTDSTNGTPRTATETRPANIGVNYIIKT